MNSTQPLSGRERRDAGVTKSGVNAITVAERQRQSPLELRKNGATWQQIADTLGYASRAGARKALTTAMSKLTREPAAELRQLELARPDSMTFAISSQVRAGHLGAIDRAPRIMERRAKYTGIDAPTTGGPARTATPSASR